MSDQLQIGRLDEMRPGPGEQVFRESRAGAYAAAVIWMTLLGFLVWLAYHGDRGRLGRLLLYLLVVGIGGISVLMARRLLGVLRHENWLLRISRDWLRINLRSSAHYAAIPQVPCVAELPRCAIASVRRSCEIHARIEDETTWRDRRIYLDINTTSANTDRLLAALREERVLLGQQWGVAEGFRSVSIPRAGTIRILMRSLCTRVTPTVREALEVLSRGSPVLPAEEERFDWDAMGRDELERLIDRLFADGSELQATCILRRRWRMNDVAIAAFFREQQRMRLGLCRECGYDMRATPLRCPECGWVAVEETISETILRVTEQEIHSR